MIDQQSINKINGVNWRSFRDPVFPIDTGAPSPTKQSKVQRRLHAIVVNWEVILKHMRDIFIICDD